MQYKMFTALPVLRDTLVSMINNNNPKVSKKHIEGILKALDKEIEKKKEIPFCLFFECISLAETLNRKHNTEETQAILDLIKAKHKDFEIDDREANIGNPR